MEADMNTALFRVLSIGIAVLLGTSGLLTYFAVHPTENLTAAAQSDAEQGAQEIMQRDSSDFPIPWPMPPLTAEQIADARACDIPELHDDRYAEGLSMDDLPTVYSPVTLCDWAVLAAAYGYRAADTEEAVPASGQQAYLNAVSGNPVLALKSWLMFGDFGTGSLVEAPPIAGQPIKTVLLEYTFAGISYQADVTVIITDADTLPSVYGHLYEYSDFREEGEEPVISHDLSGTVDPALVQALGAALTDLVPIETQFSAIGCYDYYPEWSVLLVYEDGTTLNLATNGTNFLGGGGPWQVKIDGQDYMQVSVAISTALSPIASALGIPGGTTAAMSCGSGAEFVDYAYPGQ